MPDTTLSHTLSGTPERGLPGRVLGILVSPRATYADVAARPQWLGVLLLVLVATILPVMMFLSTDVGRRAGVDQELQTLESFGRTVSNAQYQQLQRRASATPYVVAASQLVGLPLGVFVLAGLLAATFRGIGATPATFRQVCAVVAYSGAIVGVRTLLSVPLNYARETLASPTNLAAVLPFFEDNTFAGRLFGSVDLFLVWWLVNLSIGLSVLYKRRATRVAAAMLLVYVGVALAIAVAKSILTGT